MKPAPLPWFRLYAATVHDEKLRTLAFEDRWHFVALLCCKALGVLDAQSEPELIRRRVAVVMGLALPELDEAARRLDAAELITYATLQPRAWEGRQYATTDHPAARMRAYRARKAEQAASGASDGTVT